MRAIDWCKTNMFDMFVVFVVVATQESWPCRQKVQPAVQPAVNSEVGSPLSSRQVAPRAAFLEIDLLGNFVGR